MPRSKHTAAPKVTGSVVLGILALQKPGVSVALLDGTRHPNAAPDVGPNDTDNAKKAVEFANNWLDWSVKETKRKAKELRARARRLEAQI